MSRFHLFLILPVALLFVTPALAGDRPQDKTMKHVDACLTGDNGEKQEAFDELYRTRNTSVPQILKLIAEENDQGRRVLLVALLERINHQRNQEQDTILGRLTDYKLKESHFWMVLVLSAGLFVVVIDLVRRKLLRIEYSWLWVITGVAILLLVLTRLLDVVAGVIGARVPQALFFMGVLFLTLINVHYSVAISRLTNQARNLSQELALLKHEVTDEIATKGV